MGWYQRRVHGKQWYQREYFFFFFFFFFFFGNPVAYNKTTINYNTRDTIISTDSCSPPIHQQSDSTIVHSEHDALTTSFITFTFPFHSNPYPRTLSLHIDFVTVLLLPLPLLPPILYEPAFSCTH